MGLQGFPDRVGVDATKAQTVFPDIIVHHRDTNDNCLVIEIKKRATHEEKLRAFKQQLHYEHTLYLRLKTVATARVDKE